MHSQRHLITYKAEWFHYLIIGIVINSVFIQGALIKTDEQKQATLDLHTGSRDNTLQLVHVFFRHGPRTPVTTYPNDPYINNTFYPYGWGQLTNKGKLELFAIGEWLGKRYASLTGPYYTNDLLRAESTASPRTLMSMQLVLAGMFPPRNSPMRWSKELNWQPIPIYSEPLDTDVKLRMTAKCPRYDAAYQEMLELPEVKADLEKHQSLFKELSIKTGMNITSAEDINSLYITLLAEQAYGLELPEWTKDYYPHKMEHMAAQQYIYNAYTTEMRRIKGGPFLAELIGQLQMKASGELRPKERNLFLYCAHDWSIANIMLALDIWQEQMPRFSALLTIELHKQPQSEQHYVEIYFMNDPAKNLQLMKLPGCDDKCPLEKFVKLLNDVLPTKSYEDMCKV